MTMKLFPHILIRISGGGFEQLESLNLTDSIRLTDEIHQLKQNLDEMRQKISDRLYDVIPNRKDPKIQNLLLNVRRDVFNDRDIPSDTLDAVINQLPNSLKKDLRDYLKTKKTIRRLCSEGEEIFSREVSRVRKNLHALANKEIFQKGLLLSSQSLLNRIPAYAARESGLNKKDFQTERGLIKYISRMFGKTSPFSTFTNLVMGKPSSLSSAALRPEGNGGEKNKNPFLWLSEDETEKKVICHIRLNNFLYSYLKILLGKNPEIYRRFLIRPNPTLKQGEDHYLFLTNNENIEAFQRTPANPVLEVFRYLTAEKKEGIPMQEMIRSIIENEYIEASGEELEAYILQLIEYGFLEYNIGVSGIDPDWDIKLRKVLDNIDGGGGAPIPLLAELTGTLERLRILADQYGESTCAKRNEILEEAFQQFRAICMKLHEAAGLPEEERKTPEQRQKDTKEKQDLEKEKDKAGEEKSEEKEEEEEVFKHRSNTYFYFKPEQMFYEDTTMNITPCVDEAGLTEFMGVLHRLLQHMRHYEGMQDERDKMRYFSLHRYGEKAAVPLMSFYEEYYREFKKPEAELQKKKEMMQIQQQQQQQQEEEGQEKKELPKIEFSEEEKKKVEFLDVPLIRERQKRNKEWIDHFKEILKKEMIPDAEVISLEPRQVEQAHREYDVGIDPDRADSDCSYGSFIQFYREKKPDGEEKLMGVLNSAFPGFGKLFSRFLHIFDESISEDMRQWNLTLQGESLLAEDTDASYFNANLHPPLLPYEVRIPGGHNTLPPKSQVPITDLEVRSEESGDRLQLIHTPSQKRVYVIDLGFQGHKGRSQLFQLLEKFSKVEYLFPMAVANAAVDLTRPKQKPADKKEKEETPGVLVTPRVVYDDRIVLRRKTWQIAAELLPFKEPGDSPWTYFERVNRWRREHGMPDEVFVHVVDRIPGQMPPKAKSKASQKPTRDDYKPQYISFKNPFLIDLFEKLIKRVAYSLKVVEMLPNSEQLLKVGGSRHITEFTVQWYTYSKD